MSTDEIAGVVGASSLSTVCWVSPGGAPRARGAVTLVRDLDPVLAFTYADEAVAREVAAAAQVAIALQETRSTGRAFRPVLLTGRPRLVEDPTGEVYTSELVVQELRRYPPSRLFADSPLLMREHWWYLPRLIVRIDVETLAPIAPLAASHDHTLVVADGAAPVVRTAGTGSVRDDVVEVDVLGDPAPAGPAVLFGQDASFPEIERWSQWRWTGRWDGSTLAVEEAPSRTGLGPVPGLLQRWRRQRALERSCVAAIPRP